MENQKPKQRKCNQCGEMFTKLFPLQFLCSRKCEVNYKKDKYLKRKINTPKTKKKVIPPVSEKRLGELAEYRVKRTEFLARPENHYCPVVKHLLGVHVRVTEIHHTNGRENQRLNDVQYWLAVSRRGHTWIHEHPKEARKLGWLI